MKIIMAGIDYTTADSSIRGYFSFSSNKISLLSTDFKAFFESFAIISTCNRTELYAIINDNCDNCDCNIVKILCDTVERDYNKFKTYFIQRENREAVEHLFQVGAGMCSKIWGDEQIITQIINAQKIAQNNQSLEAVLSSLFNQAIASAKEIKSKVKFTAVKSSASSQAIELLERDFSLQGKNVLIIGNGEIGRYTANLLYKLGAKVTVTLRTYKHGETIVPFGCKTVPYDERLSAVEKSDIVISATTSPHFTLTKQQLENLQNRPKYYIDLAVPYDLEPQIKLLDNNIKLYNIDDLSSNPQDCDKLAIEQANKIINKHIQYFYEWLDYKNALPAIQDLKRSIIKRFESENINNSEFIVNKTVDLILGGIKGNFNSQDLQECTNKIENFTRKPKKCDINNNFNNFYFPMFCDLSDKNILIVGGGKIALRRIKVLLKYPCNIKVVAPVCLHEILDLQGKITIMQKNYSIDDIENADIAIAATDNREVNRRIGLDAKANNIPVSVSDKSEECTFYFPAICEGKYVIAGVTSKGKEHIKTAKAANKIRELIEEENL